MGLLFVLLPPGAAAYTRHLLRDASTRDCQARTPLYLRRMFFLKMATRGVRLSARRGDRARAPGGRGRVRSAGARKAPRNACKPVPPQRAARAPRRGAGGVARAAVGRVRSAVGALRIPRVVGTRVHILLIHRGVARKAPSPPRWGTRRGFRAGSRRANACSTTPVTIRVTSLCTHAPRP